MGIKRTLDAAAKAADTHERIGAWCTALGCIGVGVLVYIGPDTIPEEIPQHRAVGIGFGVFGALFLLALGARGGVGRFAKNLLLALAFGVVAGGLGFAAERKGRIVYELEQHGVELTLPVHSSIPKVRRTGSSWNVQLRDGLRRIDLDLDGHVKPGTPMTVLVHPDHATWNAWTDEGSTLIEIADARGDRWAILGCGVGAIVCALFALSFLFGAFTGAPAPDQG